MFFKILEIESLFCIFGILIEALNEQDSKITIDSLVMLIIIQDSEAILVSVSFVGCFYYFKLKYKTDRFLLSFGYSVGEDTDK